MHGIRMGAPSAGRMGAPRQKSWVVESRCPERRSANELSYYLPTLGKDSR